MRAVPQGSSQVDLTRFDHGGYRPGRSFPVRAAWLVIEALTLMNPMLTSYRLKRAVLRLFGAQIGRGVVIKPGVHVKYPWRLSIGDHAWIGERSWVDNLADVQIGAHACVSQGAYLCTGNHDWSDVGMRLMVAPIEVGDGAWIGAFAKVAPGVTVGPDAILTLGSVLTYDAKASTIYTGVPAQAAGTRRVGDDASVAAGSVR